MSIADILFGRKKNNSHSVKLNRKYDRTRNLRLEALETRDLLSVTPGFIDNSAYSALREQYPDFNLPENQSTLNVMTVDCNLADLKSAISNAKSSTKSDLILVKTSNTANTITYSSNQDELIIDINSTNFGSITIVGYGSKPLTIDANQQCRVMTINGEKTIANLGGLTITNGYSENSAKSNEYGGGIYSYDYATLTLTNCTISGNMASGSYSYGGGIYSEGTLTVTNCTISGNTSSGGYHGSFGGGIYSYDDATLAITNSTISGNTASSTDNSAFGGGIYNDDGTLTITNCTISGNTASTTDYEAYGGGFYNGGTLAITNCTISGNTASSSGNGIESFGGGIFNYETLTVTNSTISGNTAVSSGGGIKNGGTLTVINCTISGNTAFHYCSGIHNDATLTATNSIISRNYGGSLYGSLSSDSSNNLIGDFYPGFVCAPIFDSDGKLANADSMDLHLRSDSIAIDQGDNAFAENIEYDIDGNARIYGEAVDIGAYEYQGDRNDDPIPYSTVVNTLNDSFDLNDDEWSLREAICYAPEYVTITFADELEGTILLTLGQLNLETPLTIDGDNRITIDAAQNSRVFFVPVGTEESPVVLNGLTIQNGKSSDGGGIYNLATLTLTNCTISGNSTYGQYTSGGGIYNYNGTLTIVNSTISGNTASDPSCSGGGIYNWSGTVTVANCQILGNLGVSGGGIRNERGTFTVTNSTISENSVSGYYCSGGGIFNDGTLTVTNSIISQNTSSYAAGGILNYTTLTLTNCSIAGNTASEEVGGIYNYIYSPETYKATINNSIVLDAIYISSGTISGSYNLTNFNGWASGSGNIAYDSSKPLFVNAANGDYHLAKNSQAINKGKNSLAVNANGQALTSDLDNLTRIANGTVDIGAYEYHVQLSAPTLSALKTGSDSVKVTVSKVDNASVYAVEYSTRSDFTNATRQNVSSGETTITGLSPNTKYYFRALAVGSGDYRDSVFSATASATTDRAALAAPTLTSSVKNSTATFSWNADPNASGYQFEYKAAGAENWTVENVAGTSFSFEGALNATYTARVMALGGGDYVNSSYSDELEAHINGAVASINGKKVTVDWVDDSPAADSVRYRVAGTAKWTVKKLKAGVTTLTFTGKVGTDYEIEVLLDQQEVKTFKTTAVVLDQPKLKADKAFVKDDTFQVSVTNYAAKNLARNATQAILTVNGVQTTLDIENQKGSVRLTNGGCVAFDTGLFTFTEMHSNTSYKVQVAFSDGLSVSTASSALTVKTTKAPYLAPVITTATALSDTSIVVAWETAYGKDTEMPAQKYTVQYSLDGVKWSNATTGATGNSYIIQKLKGGNEYKVRVLATKDNAFNASDPSDVQTAETLALPKTTLDKASVKDDAFTVDVSNYRTTNLPKATVVNVKSDKFGETAIYLENGSGSAAFNNGMTVEFENGELTFANVPSATQQKIQVNFSDGVCTTAWSAALTVKTTKATYEKPTLTNVEVLSSTSVLVEWEPVVGKGTEIPAQKYTVQYSTNGVKWSTATTSAKGNSYTIKKLKGGVEYQIRVLASKDKSFESSLPSKTLIAETLAAPKMAVQKNSIKNDSFQISVTNYQTTNLAKATTVNVKSDKFGETAIELTNGSGTASFGDTDVTVSFDNGVLTFANVPSSTKQKIQFNFSDGVCTTAWSSALTVKTTKG